MTRPSRSVRDRLIDARRRAFVGRTAELELFAQALEGPVPAFSVLYVHGPGGIGKSTLLDRLADEAAARAVPCARVDGRATVPREESFLAALGAGADGIDGIGARLGERHVILVDTCEDLRPLEPWIRESLIPALPEGALLVLAGRDPPHPAWRADPGLAAIVRVRALRNLRADESAALLAARGVPAPLRSSAHALTHGHPLALALVAELSDGRDTALPALTPDAVRVLLDRIVRALPEPTQREALEIAALVRVVTEPLLAELGVGSPGAIFAWLRGLSFVHETEEGLAPHDLVRDAIAADLAFRDPERARGLREAIAVRNRRAFAESSGRRRERAFFDALFSLRGEPTLRPFYDWELGHSGASRRLREDELPALLAEIEQHEGAEGARIARHWWARQPEAFLALLDRAGGYVGAMVYLRLPSIPDDDAVDPLLGRAAAIVGESPLRTGEHVSVLRFWIWRDRYQELGSTAHGPHSMVVALDWALSESLAWCVLVVQRIELWRPFFAHIRFDERPDAALAFGDRRFHVLARDMRAKPWVGPEGSDAHAPARGSPEAPSQALRAPRVVLSQEDFEAAVRDALRLASRPSELAASPLLHSRLLAEWAEDEAPTPEMLRELLEVAASSLEDPRDERPRRCVELTYLRPAPTHERAAERLGLSFSTYRRQLARGVERVVAYLWEREVRGARAQ